MLERCLDFTRSTHSSCGGLPSSPALPRRPGRHPRSSWPTGSLDLPNTRKISPIHFATPESHTQTTPLHDTSTTASRTLLAASLALVLLGFHLHLQPGRSCARPVSSPRRPNPSPRPSEPHAKAALTWIVTLPLRSRALSVASPLVATTTQSDYSATRVRLGERVGHTRSLPPGRLLCVRRNAAAPAPGIPALVRQPGASTEGGLNHVSLVPRSIRIEEGALGHRCVERVIEYFVAETPNPRTWWT